MNEKNRMPYATDSEHNDMQAAIDAGIALADPTPLARGGNVVGVMVPRGADFRQVDLEKFRDRPFRKHGHDRLSTAASFIAWVNRNKTPETIISANEERASFRAVFNGHEANQQATVGGESEGAPFKDGQPGWGDFIASYDCPHSPEWKRWIGKSQHDAETKKGMAHSDFIQFIEDNLLDITNPSNGLMLSMVRAFEARKDVKFGSVVRLENGDFGFNYTEETTQTGRLTLPEKFEVTIPVFKGGRPYILDANLRHRVSGGGLILWYELVRPHKTLEAAFNEVIEEIAAGTSVPMFST